MKKILLTDVFNLYNRGEFLQVLALTDSIDANFSLLSFFCYVNPKLCHQLKISTIGRSTPPSRVGMFAWSLRMLLLYIKAWLYSFIREDFLLDGLLREIKGHDLAVDLGGDTFSDTPSLLYALKHIYTLSLLNLLGVRYVVMSHTITGFHNIIVRQMARRVLSKAEFVTVRDTISQDYLDVLRVSAVCIPDLAFLIPMVKTTGLHNKPLIGLNVSPRVFELGTFINLLYILKVQGYEFTLIPHVLGENDWYAKRNDIDVLTTLARYGEESVIQDFFQVGWAIRNCDIFIGSRMHSVIFALGSGVPSILIGYSPKADGLKALTGVPVLYSTATFVPDMVKEVNRIKADYDSVAQDTRDTAIEMKGRAGKNIEMLQGVLTS